MPFIQTCDAFSVTHNQSRLIDYTYDSCVPYHSCDLKNIIYRSEKRKRQSILQNTRKTYESFGFQFMAKIKNYFMFSEVDLG